MCTYMATRAPLASATGFKENRDLFHLPVKRTWQLLLPGSESPRGGLGQSWRGSPPGQLYAEELLGGPVPSEGRTGQDRVAAQRDWPRPSGHMEAPPPDVPGLGFPAFGAGRPHKDGIHGEALSSPRNEAGFK